VPTEEEIAALLEQYYAEEQAKYGVVSGQLDQQIPQDINNAQAPVPSDQGNYVRPAFNDGRPGIAAQYGQATGGVSLGMSGVTPQDVGVSGRLGETALDFNIPIADPTQTSFNAQTPIGPGIGKISGNINPRDRRLLLEYILSLP